MEYDMRSTINLKNNLCIDLDSFEEIQIKINGIVIKVSKEKLLEFIKEWLEK